MAAESEFGETYWGEPCVRYSYPLDRRWTVQVEIVDRGRPTIADIRIYPTPPIYWPVAHAPYGVQELLAAGGTAEDARRRVQVPGINWEVIRKVRLERIVQEAISDFSTMRQHGFDVFSPGGVPQKTQRGRALTDDQRGYTVGLYLKHQGRRDVNVAMAEEARADGFKDATPDVMRDRTRLVRRAGWLLPKNPGQGKREGRPGRPYRKWLERQEGHRDGN
jgi:hypothetical protein